MRRAALAIALTIAGLVLLLSFRTDLAPMMAASSAAPKSELTGNVMTTADGPVQVQVTVSSGKITKVSLPVEPHRRRKARRARDRAALARLIKETLAAQGADIDKVAGSGSLSTGYIRSLRSALRHALGGGRASAGRGAGSGHHHGRRKGDRRPGGGAGQPGGQ
jgi:uncharacterized protein with FMN-binding domain